MDWLNLRTSSLRAPEFIGSKPVERATWLCVLAYSVEQENGGRIVGGASWKDRQWQQTCGVTLREIRAAGKLLTVDGGDVCVWAYPAEKQAEVQLKRGAAKLGGRARWQAAVSDRTAAETRSQRLADARKLGTHTAEDWAEMISHYGRCLRCGSTEDIVKDHIVPIYRGGSDAITNLQPLCRSCNSAKGADATDHRIRAGCPAKWVANAFQDAFQTPSRTSAELEGKGKENGRGKGNGANAPTPAQEINPAEVFAGAPVPAKPIGTVPLGPHEVARVLKSHGAKIWKDDADGWLGVVKRYGLDACRAGLDAAAAEDKRDFNAFEGFMQRRRKAEATAQRLDRTSREIQARDQEKRAAEIAQRERNAAAREPMERISAYLADPASPDAIRDRALAIPTLAKALEDMRAGRYSDLILQTTLLRIPELRTVAYPAVEQPA